MFGKCLAQCLAQVTNQNISSLSSSCSYFLPSLLRLQNFWNLYGFLNPNFFIRLLISSLLILSSFQVGAHYLPSSTWPALLTERSNDNCKTHFARHSPVYQSTLKTSVGFFGPIIKQETVIQKLIFMCSKSTIFQMSSHLSWLFLFSTTESIGNWETETGKYKNAKGIRGSLIRKSM